MGQSSGMRWRFPDQRIRSGAASLAPGGALSKRADESKNLRNLTGIPLCLFCPAALGCNHADHNAGSKTASDRRNGNVQSQHSAYARAPDSSLTKHGSTRRALHQRPTASATTRKWSSVGARSVPAPCPGHTLTKGLREHPQGEASKTDTPRQHFCGRGRRRSAAKPARTTCGAP